MAPEVSVLICAHNEEKYIGEAVKSVLVEKNIKIEVIVVNDRSTDRTPEILNDLVANDSRIKIITRVDQESLVDHGSGKYYMQDHGYGGQTDALNLGLQHCSGRYIARLDADDLCLSDRFEKQLAYLQANPEVSFLGGSAVRIDNAGREFGAYHARPLSHEEIVSNLESFKAYAPHSSWMVKALVYKSLNGYNENGFRAEDLDFMLRASEMEGLKFGFLTDPVIQLRMQDNRLSTGMSTVPFEHAIESVVRHMLRLKGVNISPQLHDSIRSSVQSEVQKYNLVYDLVAYRAMVNSYIALKTKKYFIMSVNFLKVIRYRPLMLFKKGLFSQKKLDVVNRVCGNILKEYS